MISIITGVGMMVLGVPYAVFLGVLAFVLEFVPVIGAYLTGAVCVLLALSQGWVTALLALIFVTLLQAFEGNVLVPRILGRAIGLHPIVAIFALIAGNQLFGLPGAIFASPVAGVLQALLLALWINWQKSNLEQFSEREDDTTRTDEVVE